MRIMSKGAIASSYSAPVGGFTPADLTDLEAWWDFTLESVGDLSTISDLSGNGWTLTQGTGTRQPTITASAIGSQKAAYFNGTSDILENTSGVPDLYNSTNGWSIIAVVRLQDNGSNEHWLYDESSTTTSKTTFGLNAQNSTDRDYRVANRGDDGNFKAGECTNVDYTDDTSQWIMFDGTKTEVDALCDLGDTDALTLESVTMTLHDGFFVGGLYWNNSYATQAFAKGYIAELILMKNRLTSTEISNLDTYFNTKYGL